MNARSAGLVLALVGLAVVAHPLYLFPHHGQSSVFVHQFEELGSDRPSGEVVEYADLPPEAQQAVDATEDGESPVLWHGDDEAAIDALQSAEYLERDGTYYAYDLAHRGGVVLGTETSLRVLLTGLGSLALVVGALVARTGSLRPLAPRSALAVPAVAAVGVLATNAYDVALSGASEYFLFPAEAFGPIALLGVAAGSAVRRGDVRTAVGIATLGAAASLAALVGGADLPLALLVGVPSVVPALVLGVLLTDPATNSSRARTNESVPNRL